MKKQLKFFIIFILLMLAILFTIRCIRQKTFYNDNYVNGNSSGNLYNAGLFCENNGKLFFSNQNDDGKLYSMDVNGDNLEKLCDDTALYINADKNYIYYVRNNNNALSNDMVFSYSKNSLCRISRTSGDIVILDSDPCIYASLVGNYIYYLHYDDENATCLYKIKIDGTEKTKLLNHYIFTCNTSGQYFYYNSPDDGSLYRYDTKTEQSTLIYECNCYKPVVIDDINLYYMDASIDNAIVHLNIESPYPITLTDGDIEHFNVYGSHIYYQRGGDNPALCVIENDGSNYQEIASGEYRYINVTSEKIYFTDFYSGEVFCAPLSNPTNVEKFSPGIIN